MLEGLYARDPFKVGSTTSTALFYRKQRHQTEKRAFFQMHITVAIVRFERMTLLP